MSCTPSGNHIRLGECDIAISSKCYKSHATNGVFESLFFGGYGGEVLTTLGT